MVEKNSDTLLQGWMVHYECFTRGLISINWLHKATSEKCTVMRTFLLFYFGADLKSAMLHLGEFGSLQYEAQEAI